MHRVEKRPFSAHMRTPSPSLLPFLLSLTPVPPHINEQSRARQTLTRGPIFTRFEANAALDHDGISGFQSGGEDVVSQMSEIEP